MGKIRKNGLHSLIKVTFMLEIPNRAHTGQQRHFILMNGFKVHFIRKSKYIFKLPTAVLIIAYHDAIVF